MRLRSIALTFAASALLLASCMPTSRSPSLETPSAPALSPTTMPSLNLDRVSLPPHVVAAGGGWLTCERGFTLRDHRCIADDQVAHGATIEVSSLPSAGEGSSQPRACPSGGCTGAALPPFLSPTMFGGGAGFDPQSLLDQLGLQGGLNSLFSP